MTRLILISADAMDYSPDFLTPDTTQDKELRCPLFSIAINFPDGCLDRLLLEN
jgi:hypothetical protein